MWAGVLTLAHDLHESIVVLIAVFVHVLNVFVYGLRHWVCLAHSDSIRDRAEHVKERVFSLHDPRIWPVGTGFER